MRSPMAKIAGKYTLGRKLGAGAFGEVYAGMPIGLMEHNIGMNIEVRQEVAIKMVQREI